MTAPDDIKKTEKLLFATFLESGPPGAVRTISNLFSMAKGIPSNVDTPDIKLYCSTETCNGFRIFTCPSPSTKCLGGNVFLNYVCRNCKGSSKVYALRVDWIKAHQFEASGMAEKYGEIPAFGPPLPSRLISMVGADRKLFLKGWRAELQSLGIGSFAYYRRVVEHQKKHIFEEIHKAAERLGSDRELLSSLTSAKEETQFSKAIDLVKNVLPDGLKVQGQDPLKLLHRALSKGVHNLSDEECLGRAQAIRVILTELVSNIAQVMKDEREVSAAIKKLQSIPND